jgi:putative PIN family toxin of toxin-antitoxin system
MPMIAPESLVIDTNVALGWLVLRDPWCMALEPRLRDKQAVWLLCPAMADELAHVLARPLSRRWESAREHALTLCWSALASMVEPSEQMSPAGLRCRDRADQKFIDLAFARHADWVLTLDRDLISLRRRASAQGLAIATPQQWAATHAV